MGGLEMLASPSKEQLQSTSRRFFVWIYSVGGRTSFGTTCAFENRQRACHADRYFDFIHLRGVSTKA
jgi:hypothetical protein